MAKQKYGIDLDTALSELHTEVETAVNFFASEFEGDWATAEKYFAGETDLEEFAGRSNVVKTEVRDAIRNATPSIMRSLLHAKKIVEYIPSDVRYGAWAEQQALYITQLFWKCDGYRQLLAAWHQAARLKATPLKAYWLEDPLPDYFEYTKLTLDRVEMLINDPELELEEIEFAEQDDADDLSLPAIPLYNVSGYRYKKNGKIVFQAIPIYEFFINRNADGIADAVEYGIHGHTRDVTVEEAISLGLEYDDWQSLDSSDPEIRNYSEQSYWRRGYQKHSEDEASGDDLLSHVFLLTEVYKRYDLKGTGRPQLYRFWLGGTSYTYIDHEEVEESPFELMEIDPQPFSPLGNSLADITIREQDTSTSLLRATIDNAHMANNPRHFADPTRVNFDDLMNHAIGAPGRIKGEYQVQTVTTPFTGQFLLPLLDYLDRDTQMKTGVTKAAYGLDPDAMQSTDKNAVINTIQMSQGQVELMLRNMIETGLIPIFRKILRLSIRHMDPIQLVKTKGQLVPVPQGVFDPDMAAIPNVGLGTTSPQEKAQTLAFILQKQEAVMQQMGPDNPFTSLSQIYNTLEDLVELGGIIDVGRYFNIVTPDIEKKLAEQKAKEAERMRQEQLQNKPMDPAQALIFTESKKAEVRQLEVLTDAQKHNRDLEYKALKDSEELDIQRDKLVQDRVIELMKLGKDRANARIKAEQKGNNTKLQSAAGGNSGM